MTSTTSILRFNYLPSPWEDRVHSVCASWKGTRYKPNGKHRHRGVDCLHFVAGVLDELSGVSHCGEIQSLPPDACVHNLAGIRSAARALKTRYPCVRVTDGSLEAGDVVILGRRGPEHLCVASKRACLWEAIRPTVAMAGYGAPAGYRVIATYRPKNKQTWA